VQRDQLASQSTGGHNADLLAQDSPQRYLKTVPAAGSPQSRTLRHQGSECRIAGQMAADGLDVQHPGVAGQAARDPGATILFKLRMASGVYDPVIERAPDPRDLPWQQGQRALRGGQGIEIYRHAPARPRHACSGRLVHSGRASPGAAATTGATTASSANATATAVDIRLQTIISG